MDNSKLWFYCTSFILIIKVVSALQKVSLILEPEIVERFHNCILRCNYDLQGLPPIYTVKFFRGNHEFYRYSPGEEPSIKTFTIPGINVDEINSNGSQVILTNVDFKLSGNFTCEVTTDIFFLTLTDTKVLKVIQLPRGPPVLWLHSVNVDYRNTLQANCSSPPSRPPAKLKIILNNITIAETKPASINNFEEVEKSHLSVYLPLSELHNIRRGRITIVCVSEVLDLYKKMTDVRLDSALDPVPERVSAGVNRNPGFHQNNNLVLKTVILFFVVEYFKETI